MFKMIAIPSHVEHSDLGTHLYKQERQKIAERSYGFRLKKHKQIHVYHQDLHFLRNNISFHKKVNVHFYMGKTVFFSWGFSL